jgi:hypothetical protein
VEKDAQRQYESLCWLDSGEGIEQGLWGGVVAAFLVDMAVENLATRGDNKGSTLLPGISVYRPLAMAFS